MLGTHRAELDRLRLQQELWAPVTNRFLDRLKIQPGWRVLDLGCGPGFVTLELRERVGPEGEVVGLDRAEHWLEHLRRAAAERGFDNVTVRNDDATALEDRDRFDLVFSRWVVSFLPEPQPLIRRLARALAPGGTLAIQDYNHEGVSLFPRSEAFDAAIRATRALYTGGGGDPWIAGRLPALFSRAGLEETVFETTVLCGGPDSPAFRWAHAFFPAFIDTFTERGLMTREERDRFEADWAERRADPTSRFFSPIVVDAAARRPS